jgi:hypothetical protein
MTAAGVTGSWRHLCRKGEQRARQSSPLHNHSFESQQTQTKGTQLFIATNKGDAALYCEAEQSFFRITVPGNPKRCQEMVGGR